MENCKEKIIKAIKENDFMLDYTEDKEITIQAIINFLPDIEEAEIKECISKWDEAQMVDGFKGIIRISKDCFK